jgi:hypothetical protein
MFSDIAASVQSLLWPQPLSISSSKQISIQPDYKNRRKAGQWGYMAMAAGHAKVTMVMPTLTLLTFQYTFSFS